MSGIVKGIVKVFKKVVKTVVKIAPYVLAAAAVVFTAGMILAPAGMMAGGWAAASASLVGLTGASGTLAGVLTGALTYAGYGAAIGGIAAAATGGDIGKGITAGAITGAVTGGFLGYIDPTIASNTLASYQAGGANFVPAAGTAPTGTPHLGPTPAQTAGGAGQPGIVGPRPATPAGGTAIVNAGASPEVLAAETTGKYLLAGNVIQGLGAGLAASGEAGAAADLAASRAANYDSDGLLIDRDGTGQSIRGMRPTGVGEMQSGRFERDPETGRLVYIPAGPRNQPVGA